MRQAVLASAPAWLLAVGLTGCGGGAAPEPEVSGSPVEASADAAGALADALTFHASFDNGLDAGVAALATDGR